MTWCIQKNSALIKSYKEILLSNWDKDFPAKVLNLLWQTIVPIESQSDELIHILNPQAVSPFPSNYFQKVFSIILDGHKILRSRDFPPLPITYSTPKRMSRAVLLACRFASYLTLPAHAGVKGDIDFFSDLQSLAFQACIHFALPEIREKHSVEHSILLHAASIFAVSYSSDDPAQYAYLQSTIYDYLGAVDLRLDSLYASFRFTSPQDHSYLTKAQEYWMELLDNKKYDETEHFLFSLHSLSFPEQREEIREMIVEALGYIFKNQGTNATA